jgi:anti-sigma-K factor RskA
MTRDHELIDELLAARALDGLEEDDAALLARELAGHGACDECRRLETHHAEVAAMLALALDPRPVREEMIDRILGASTMPPATPAAAPDRIAARGETHVGRWQAAFGVAAAVALVLAFVLATRPGADPVVRGATMVTFEGADGELALAYTPGERGVVVWGTGLPDPGAGRLYELWLIEDGEPARGACLAPSGGAVAAYVDADLSSTDLMAVTVESAACPDAPTDDPLYTAELG